MKLEQKQYWQKIQDADDQEFTAFVIELSRPYVAQYPQHGMAWLLYATTLVEMGHYAEAEAALHNAIARCPEEHHDIPYSWLGHLYNEQGHYHKAEKWYQKACDVKPDDATYWIFLGSNYFKMGNVTQAESCVRQAITCQEGCLEEAYFNLGGYLLAQQKYEEAETCYKKAIERDPHYKEAIVRLQDVHAVLAYFQHAETPSRQDIGQNT